jgi:hypothetical protein
MLTAGQSIHRNSRAELQTWYLASLQPRLRDAESAGIVSPAAADALDREIRDFLNLPGGGREENL